MKKNGVLNSDLSRIIASMGHTDMMVICDSGLPIPRNSHIIDLALTRNIPGFLDTLRVILQELQVEKAIVASELYNSDKKLYTEIKSLLNSASIKRVTHNEFKKITRNGDNITFVRTGEATPYANIILVSGVTF